MAMRERSLWEATAEPAPDVPALDGPVEADVAIVGAGFTGLSTAIHLAEMGRSVVAVEAGEPGAGASGRNGGQVIAGLKHRVADVVADYGEARGRRLHAFGVTTADACFDLIARHAIPCDATRGGWIQAAETEAERTQARARVAAWESVGAPVRMLERDAFRDLTGTDAYVGGWLDARGGSVQPLSLARGMARAAVGLGARLFARTPALSMTRAGPDWAIATPNGRVTARRVLLATNAGVGGLAPDVQRSQLVVRSFQIATRPLTEAERAVVLPTRAVVSDTRRVVRYFRVDRDHRLIVGGKGTLGAPKGLASFAFQREMLATLYPALRDVEIEAWWGGEIGITLDRLPRLFTLGEGAYAVLQDNGKGVAWCTAAGAPLAELLTGADADTLPLPPIEPPRPIPFHLFQTAYKAAGGAWYRLLDRVDRLHSR